MKELRQHWARVAKKALLIEKRAFFYARWYLQVLLKIKTKTNPFKTSYTKVIRPKKIILLFPEMPVKKKIFTSAVAKKIIHLIEFFKQSLHLKYYSNSDFLCWKTKSPIFYCLKGKKRKFVGTNLLVEIILCVCVFFKQKCIFSYTFHWCRRVGEKTNFFSPGRFRKQDYFFWPKIWHNDNLRYDVIPSDRTIIIYSWSSCFN